MSDEVEEVGLLLVHGMGEQGKLAHLRATARELASCVASSPGLIRLDVSDRTDSPDPEIVVDAVFSDHGRRRVRLHLHEVWWADLGISGGVGEQLAFWLWGLGQWAAEVVRKGTPHLNTEQLMAMPRFGYQASPSERPGFWRKLPSRAMLFGAALLAILTFFTWSAAKQVIALLSKRLPDPSLIFLFLGDVKIYERPGGPGKGSLQDPDMPMRATIRRRMVSGMVGIAAQNYDRWYILAHSLGTIPAFNAIQETELALPNYLSKAQWDALPVTLKTQSPFKPEGAKPTTSFMMPRRPPWLGGSDGIDRLRLFERFRGFITYGCPLDKFAALWPRVVPLNRQAAVFPAQSEWVNLHDPTDPVAAHLDAFEPPQNAADTGAKDRIELIPKNFPSRASWIFGLAHIRYLTPRRRQPTVMAAALTEALIAGPGRKLSEAAAAARMSTLEAWLRMMLAVAQLAALAMLLSAAAAALLIAIGKLLPDSLADAVKAVLRAVAPQLLTMLQAGGLKALAASGLIVLLLALAAVIVAGIARIGADMLVKDRR